MASPRGPSDTPGLRVNPGLMRALRGPRAGLWRNVTAGVIAVLLSPIIANIGMLTVAPGSKLLAGLVCPPEHELVEMRTVEVVAGTQRGRGYRDTLLACRDRAGLALQSRLPHDKIIAYGGYLWILLAFLPIRLMLARIFRKPESGDPATEERTGSAPASKKMQQQQARDARRKSRR